MPRGKPFICWLSTKGHHHDVGLYVGDEVEFQGKSGEWVLGRIGRKRIVGFNYVVRWGNKEEVVWMTTQLRPLSRNAIKKGGE